MSYLQRITLKMNKQILQTFIDDIENNRIITSFFFDFYVLPEGTNVQVKIERERLLQTAIYLSEENFTLWRERVEEYYIEFCPNLHKNGTIFISSKFLLEHIGFIMKAFMVTNHYDMLLLLRSGDIELNPGPIYSKFLKSEQEKQLAYFNHCQRINDKKRTLEKKERQQLKNQKQMNRFIAAGSLKFQMFKMYDNIKQTAENCASGTEKFGEFIGNAHAFTDQMKESFKEIPTVIRQHINLAELTTNTIKLMQNSISQIKDKTFKTIDYLVSQFTTKFSPVSIIATFVMCIVALQLPDFALLAPVLLFTLYLAGWHQIVIDKIKEILNKFTPEQWKFQSGLADGIPFIGQIIFTILAFLGISKIPSNKFYDNLIKRLDLIPKSVIGAGKIWEAAGQMFDTVSEEFQVYFLKKSRSELHYESNIVKEVSVWSERVFHYLQVPERTSLSKDEVAVREVEALFTQMYRWKHTTGVWKTLPLECQRIIASLTPQMSDLYRVLCKSSVHEGGPRKAPIAVLFSGDSGRGKSELLIPLSYALLHHRGYTKNLRNEIYVRNYETEYWDGYVGQKIVHFDDAFQVKDTVSSPSVEFMEAIRVNNTAPAHVHCADTGDKGRFFSSEICIYTTNLSTNFRGYIQSMNCPEATVRRLNMNAFRILTKKKFESLMTVGEHRVSRLNKQLIGYTKGQENEECICPESIWNEDLQDLYVEYNKNCKAHYCHDCKKVCEKFNYEQMPFCPHHYLFQRYDMENDLSIGEPLDYNQLLQTLRDFDTKLVSREENKLDFYENFSENVHMFELQGKEEFIACQDKYMTAPLFTYDTEQTHAGILDLSNPMDHEAWWIMNQFINWCELRFGNLTNYLDLFQCELVARPYIYKTYLRAREFGICGVDNKNTSLTDMLYQRDIFFDFDANRVDGYMSRKLLPSLKTVISRFKDYCIETFNKVGDFLQTAPILRLVTIFTWILALRPIFDFGKSLFKKKKEKKYDYENSSGDNKINTTTTLKTEALFGPCQFQPIVDSWQNRNLDEFNINDASAICNTNCFFKCDFCAHIPEFNCMLELGFTPDVFVRNQKKMLELGLKIKEKYYSFENSSGDNKVNTQLNLKTENSSGDNKATTQVAMRTENSSGDNKINTINTLRTEHKDEPIIKIPQKLECVKEKVENLNLKTEALSDFNGRRVTHKLIQSNLFCLHSERSLIGNVLFVKGCVLLMPYHYIAQIERSGRPRNSILKLSNMSGNSLCEIMVSDLLDCHIRLTKNGHETDAVLVPLDNVRNKVCNHKDIIDLFVPTKVLQNFPETCKYEGELPSYSSLSQNLDKFVPTIQNCKDIRGFFDVTEPISVSDDGVVINYRNAWTYFSRTIPGDCGAPIVLHEPSASHKIMGIHVAGQANGVGLGQVITQEMLREAFVKIPFKYQSTANTDKLVTQLIDLDVELEGSVPCKSGLRVLGKIPEERRVTGGGNTKIRPSVLYDEIVPHKTAPTQLKPKNGVDPMLLGLKKFGKNVPHINPILIHIASNDVQNNLNMNAMNLNVDDYRRVLSYEEAVQGVPGNDFFAPLNRKTSMGYPYTVDHPNAKGKRDAFGEEEWTMDTPLALKIKKDCEQLEESCKNNIQEDVYWTDTLKDERRPLEKVALGKTRVFTAGPVHFTIVFRRFFLGFAAWMMYNRNFNEISTGTNVFSHDWNTIAKKLASRGTCGKKVNVVAGDFENFDGSLSSQILWRMLEMINEWYNDSEENKQIRTVLWTHIVHATHINNDVVYSATHSQPSGCPLTAILNSVYNSIVIRITYIICACNYERENNITAGTFANMKSFNQFVSCVSYGDDNLIAIMNTIISWFNQQTITAAFLEIGHVYTDERKTGEIFEIRDLKEVAYLKRKFVFDEENQRYIAPLDLDVVLEIFQWTKKGLMSDDITLANIDVTLRELSLHGKETFNFYAEKLRQVCISKNIGFRFKSFQEYKCAVLDVPLKLEANKEDIFEQEHFIVHCVSGDMKMSKGFAAELVRRRLNKEILSRMRSKQHQIGFVYIESKSRTIHLVTKNLFFNKPRDQEGLKLCLFNLNKICKKRGIKNLVMPPLQCGLDAKYTHFTQPQLEVLLRQYLIDVNWRIFNN